MLESTKKESDDPYEDDDLLDMLDYNIFQPYQSMEKLNEILDNPGKALKMAERIESRAISFYESCRDVISNQKTKDALTRIIEEEARHKKHFGDIMKELV